MFLVAVTRRQIRENLRGVAQSAHQVEPGPLVITIAVDGFLSHYSSSPNGFAVVESPSVDGPDLRRMVLAQVTFDRVTNTLRVFQATHSTRSIYYHMNAQGDFYCSTHVSLLRQAGVPVAENTDVLPEFFSYRGVVPPRTLYKGIDRVSFGGTLNIGLAGDRCVFRSEDKYSPFDPDVPPVPPLRSLEACVAEFHRTLLHFVGRLQPYASRLAALQSGGLDSSILFSLCRDTLGTDESYSASYPLESAAKDAEWEYATSAADALGSRHRWYSPDNGEYLHGLLEALAIAEEPVIHLQSVMIYLLLKNTVPATKDVVLSAAGADLVHCFQEQRNVYRWNTSRVYRMLGAAPVYPLLQCGANLTGRGRGHVSTLASISENIGRGLRDPRHLAHFGNSCRRVDWACDYFGVKIEDVISSRSGAIESYNPGSIYDALSASAMSDVYVPSSLWSKLAERSGKRLYFPFLEREVMELGFAAPWKLKLRQPKGVLRALARTLDVPEFIITRPKSGFGWSPSRWAVRGGSFDALVPLAAKAFDKSVLVKMQSDDPESAMLFWTMLDYALWKRLSIDGEPLDTLHEELARSLRDGAH